LVARTSTIFGKSRHLGCLLAATAILVLVVGDSIQADERDADGAALKAEAAAAAFRTQYFDQIVFGSQESGARAAAFGELHRYLRQKIVAIDLVCELTEPQR